ncbi:hypothetical protein LCGC14_0220550 [marine sediment metagenome]|uniref:Uncharacterized protein n=1 Tax=marine sediment metagenome TaxID=412755 RepID=A0A0F9UHP9_9ZZZZ
MSTRTLVSIDLDWLNSAKHPIRQLRELLHHIPRDTPAIITIEHHEFLPQLHKWVKSGKVKTPFNILNIDEHHDYYRNCPPFHPEGTDNNCGNWGYRIPTKWYDRYTWVNTVDSDLWHDWTYAQEWLDNHGIKHSVRGNHRLSRLSTEFVAAIFCVSPDFLGEDMLDLAPKAVGIIACHFKIARAPEIISDDVGNYDGLLRRSVSGWRMAARPKSAKLAC